VDVARAAQALAPRVALSFLNGKNSSVTFSIKPANIFWPVAGLNPELLNL